MHYWLNKWFLWAWEGESSFLLNIQGLLQKINPPERRNKVGYVLDCSNKFITVLGVSELYKNNKKREIKGDMVGTGGGYKIYNLDLHLVKITILKTTQKKSTWHYTHRKM